jgi:hypothetical protein
MARLGFAYLQGAPALPDAKSSFPHPRPGLLCQSIELLLESRLQAHEYGVGRLKSPGHDLTRLVGTTDEITHRLQSLDDEPRADIHCPSRLHESRLFGYFRMGLYAYPTDAATPSTRSNPSHRLSGPMPAP